MSKESAILERIILEGLERGDPLSSILYRIHNELQLSIQIVSVSAKIIFSLPSFDNKDFFDLFKDVPKEDISAFFSSNEPSSKYASSKTAIICPIVINHNPISTVNIDCLGPQYSHEYMYFAAKRISQLCGRLFNEDIYMASSSSMFNSFLSQYIFLAGTVSKTDNTGELVQSLIAERHLHPPYVFIAFKSKDFNDDMLIKAEAYIERYVSHALHLVGNGFLYFFMTLRSGQSFDRESGNIGWISTFCSSFNLRCAISPCFSNISDRSFYKKLVCSVLDNSEKTENIIFIDEQYNQIVYFRAQKAFGRTGMELEEITILKEYDQQHNTSYLETLSTYLSCCNKLSLASKMLFIDHSTLSYRLKKIRELIGLDIDIPENAERLRYSIEGSRFKRFT